MDHPCVKRSDSGLELRIAKSIANASQHEQDREIYEKPALNSKQLQYSLQNLRQHLHINAPHSDDPFRFNAR